MSAFRPVSCASPFFIHQELLEAFSCGGCSEHKGQAKPASTFNATAPIVFLSSSLAKASHMAEPHTRGTVFSAHRGDEMEQCEHWLSPIPSYPIIIGRKSRNSYKTGVHFHRCTHANGSVLLFLILVFHFNPLPYILEKP